MKKYNEPRRYRTKSFDALQCSITVPRDCAYSTYRCKWSDPKFYERIVSSFCFASVSDKPSISIHLCGDVLPRITRTASLGRSNAAASSFSMAAFALPCSGGALTRIFNSSPSQPTMQSRDEPGTALT